MFFPVMDSVLNAKLACEVAEKLAKKSVEARQHYLKGMVDKVTDDELRHRHYDAMEASAKADKAHRHYMGEKV